MQSIGKRSEIMDRLCEEIHKQAKVDPELVQMLNEWQQKKNSYENIGVNDDLTYEPTKGRLVWVRRDMGNKKIKTVFTVKNNKIVNESQG